MATHADDLILSRLLSKYGSLEDGKWTHIEKEFNEQASQSRSKHWIKNRSKKLPCSADPEMQKTQKPQRLLERRMKTPEPGGLVVSVACANPACNKHELDNNFKMCAGCGMVRYCSRECSRIDWKRHKQTCTLAATLFDKACLEENVVAGSHSAAAANFAATNPGGFLGLSVIASLQRDAPWGIGPAIFRVIPKLTTSEQLFAHIIPGHALEPLRDIDTTDYQRLGEDHFRDVLSRVDIEVGFYFYVSDMRSKNRMLGGARVRYPCEVDVLRAEAVLMIESGDLQIDANVWPVSCIINISKYTQWRRPENDIPVLGSFAKASAGDHRLGCGNEQYMLEINPSRFASGGPAVTIGPALPPKAKASSTSRRRIMDRDWNCDICNTAQVRGTEAEWWDHHPTWGSYAICDECKSAGRSPDNEECSIQ